MLEGHNIICFSNDWHQDPLSKHHIMSRLAKQNKVLWINSIGMRKPTATAKDLTKIIKKIKSIFKGLQHIDEGLYVYTPIVLPYNNKLISSINNNLLRLQIKLLQKKLHLNNPILWSFLPNMVRLVGSFGEKLTIYYCTDDFTKFEGYAVQKLVEQEKKIINMVGISFFTALSLLTNKGSKDGRSYLMRHGVDLEHFEKAWKEKQSIPSELAGLKKPVIGFWGELNESVDYELLKNLALMKPEWSFVLIGGSNYAGSTRLPTIEKISNIYMLGPKPYSKLPQYAASFDVAILPKNKSELALNMNPLKLREYLAAGLPVVSTPLPEVLAYGDVVRFADTVQEYVLEIETCLKFPKQKQAVVLSQRVKNESWDSKVVEISAIIEKVLVK